MFGFCFYLSVQLYTYTFFCNLMSTVYPFPHHIYYTTSPSAHFSESQCITEHPNSLFVHFSKILNIHILIFRLNRIDLGIFILFLLLCLDSHDLFLNYELINKQVVNIIIQNNLEIDDLQEICWSR